MTLKTLALSALALAGALAGANALAAEPAPASAPSASAGIVTRGWTATQGHGPSTVPGTPFFTMLGQGDLELYMADNLAFDAQGKPVGLMGSNAQTTGKVIAVQQPTLPPNLPGLRPAASLAQELPPLVGARSWARDPLDAKLLADMAQGKGKLIDSEVENVLGYPSHAPTRRAFKPEDWNLDDMSPKAGWPNLVKP